MTTSQNVTEERWTPVSEALPPVGKVVSIVYWRDDGPLLSFGRLEPNGSSEPVWMFSLSRARLGKPPDAWQPIPPPPPPPTMRMRLAWQLDRWGWRLVKLSKRLEG